MDSRIPHLKSQEEMQSLRKLVEHGFSLQLGILQELKANMGAAAMKNHQPRGVSTHTTHTYASGKSGLLEAWRENPASDLARVFIGLLVKQGCLKHMMTT